MKFFFCLCFLVVTCGLSVGIIREYSFHDLLYVTWTDAQWHCRRYYRDLATVTTTEENQRLVYTGKNDYSAWIGLYRSDANSLTWKWSDEEPISFLNWESGWPLPGSVTPVKNCAVVYNGVWYNDPCDSKSKYFYCYRYLILVNKLMTWEEALQYCTTEYTGLASLANTTQIWQANQELALTQTDSVWVALRYIDGKWFWLSESPLGVDSGTGNPPDPLVSMPSCPALPYRCGAINTKTNGFENRDCNEKLNVLCWK
ncbi:C-type mannose receptor 2-like [Silurus meridionalis]|uniref:C-type mannose receptor 2-like n=1 Tax=Silurus meridionalis TaxID=175797 RepID=UPI001EEA6961|nr:C-type mannose receptor 2-like [Silurus meridionalis]